jgi:GAF domain-containing protein
VQPVFDSILERAVRLSDALFGAAFSFDGEHIHLVAHHGLSDEALAISQRVYPMAPGPEQVTARAVLEREVVHVPDVDTDPDTSATTRDFARTMGFRSLVAVPMLREGRAVGVLTLTRATGEFSTRHIELVKTFADQAVIAIENVRLFQELRTQTEALERSVGELRALHEVGQAVSSTLDLETVLMTIVTRANQLSGTDGGAVFEYDEARGVFPLRAAQGLEDELVQEFQTHPVRLGEGVVGRAAAARRPAQIPDVLVAGA